MRLPRPKDAVKFGVMRVGSVDLRNTQVAATAVDIFEYSYTETTAGRNIRSFLAAASEGDSDEHARGLAIQSATTDWTLTNASHAGDPDETLIFRRQGSCLQRERLVSAGENGTFLATDVAVDGASLYLLVPGIGIVTHTFTPEPTPAC